jgi:hypothetical protein
LRLAVSRGNDGHGMGLGNAGSGIGLVGRVAELDVLRTVVDDAVTGAARPSMRGG